MNHKENRKGQFFLLVSIAMLLLISAGLANSWRTAQGVSEEITELQSQIQNLEQENYQFKELIDYFNSTAYIEEKARLDLGLKKEGEKVVIVTDDANIQKSNSDQNNLNEKASRPDRPETNPSRWWQYFFK